MHWFPKSKIYKVCLIGLYGVGGIGKSRMCKSMYNEFVSKLENKSQIELLQETLKKLTNTNQDSLSGLNEDEVPSKIHVCIILLVYSNVWVPINQCPLV